MRVLTERDLQPDFFDQKSPAPPQTHGKKRNRRLLAPCRKLRSCGRSTYSNFQFTYTFILPQVGSLISRKWQAFSCRALFKRTFPGLQLLRCLGSVITGGASSSSLKSHASDAALMMSPSNNDVLLPEHELQVKLEEKYPTPQLVKSTFLTDIFAGFSVGAMSVPQGMSYALLAGLEIQYGLYNNFIYPYCFFLLGTCRHAVIGVSAVESIMVGTAITAIIGKDTTDHARHNVALALCLASAIVYMLFRVCKLAVLADLLADPVLSGFATASAFLVGTSQLKYVFGFSVIESDWGLPRVWLYILRHLNTIAWAPFVCCFVSLIFLFLCKRMSRFCGKFLIPGPLLLVIASCLVSWSTDLNGNYGIKIVGHIPQGVPALSWPEVSWIHGIEHPELPSFARVFFRALVICPLFFVIHMSIAKTIAMRQNYTLDVAQELVAFSGCNLIGTFLSAYPATTSLSRSSVTESLGAKTHFHNLAAGTVVLCTILFLTRPLGYLPMASLAAVVLFGVSKMAEFEKLAELWRLQKANWAASDSIGGGVNSPDLLLWLVSFFATAIVGATEGILISVALSLIWIGKEIVRPEFIQLGRLEGTEIYRNQVRFPQALQEPGIALYRIDAPLNFCNAGFLERNVKASIIRHFETEELRIARLGIKRRSPSSANCLMGRHTTSADEHLIPSGSTCANSPVLPPFFFILDCSSVNGLDVTAISAFARVAVFAQQYQCTLLFANWKGPQRDYLQRANFYKIVPPQRCFLSNHDAVMWAKALREKVCSPVGSPRGLESVTSELRRRLTTSSEEIELSNNSMPVIEWDGLSALVPNVRYVREHADDGDRNWPVAVVERPRVSDGKSNARSPYSETP